MGAKVREMHVIWRCCVALAVGVGGWSTTSVLGAEPAALQLKWDRNLLVISGPQVPGTEIAINYLEAYCRAGSTDRDWGDTVIPHQTRLVSASDDGTRLELQCRVSDGVIVDHVITSTHDQVDFQITAHNPTERPSEIHWAQPCMRVDRFTGRDQAGYLEKCFVFLDGQLTRMPTRDWATQARYTPGQVWCPAGVDRNDVNPRPLSSLVPSHGLIGCYSADESMILATAFEPYQELFQGVITCIHSDFRIGGLAPGETKKVRGKIYIVPAEVPRLVERYRRDFPEHLAVRRPNIVYVLCDDLGYGDVRAFNPHSQIDTSHLDRLARDGMIFTDMHSPSSVCSPTRYGILTGRYAWRSRLQSGVLGGLSPRLIEPDRLTVAELLRRQGYATACIGKWHLGLDWVKKPGREISPLSIETPNQVWNVDYSQPYTNGPNSVGFDYYYGISASLDMVPYTFLENDRVTVVPTVDKSFPLVEGRDKGSTRVGPAAPNFDARDVLPKLVQRTVSYLAEHASDARSGKPFFLYVPLAAPHSPVMPTAAWQNRSGLNPYADFVLQTDDAIGQILEALDQHQLTDNTLVIVTSDNGCSTLAGYDELLAKGHNPSHVYRGQKADIYEGGHRVPFIVRWPGHVAPGTTSAQLGCLTDFMATAAELTGASLPDDAGEDSFSLLNAMTQVTDRAPRPNIVHHSINGSFGVRTGEWKLALCPDSGGWSEPHPPAKVQPNEPAVQLYDLSADISERRNLAKEQPQRVKELASVLETIVAQGRSTPGSAQANTVDPDIWRYAPSAKPH
ncbi:MAG: arylsulfatase [Pirellulales bacterium]